MKPTDCGPHEGITDLPTICCEAVELRLFSRGCEPQTEICVCVFCVQMTRQLTAQTAKITVSLI